METHRGRSSERPRRFSMGRQTAKIPWDAQTRRPLTLPGPSQPQAQRRDPRGESAKGARRARCPFPSGGAGRSLRLSAPAGFPLEVGQGGTGRVAADDPRGEGAERSRPMAAAVFRLGLGMHGSEGALKAGSLVSPGWRRLKPAATCVWGGSTQDGQAASMRILSLLRTALNAVASPSTFPSGLTGLAARGAEPWLTGVGPKKIQNADPGAQ
jgi:hypothetical protein